MLEQNCRYLSAKPFEPFALQIADGRVLTVSSPDGLWVTPRGGLCYWHQEDDTMERINLLLVTGVRGTLSHVE